MAKTVLITGGSRGIGAAAARCFAAEGYRVVINYLKNREAAEKLACEITGAGGAAIAVCADVADYEAVRHMFADAEEHFGGVDILINNAGVAEQKLLVDMSPLDWDKMVDVDLKGVFNCCRIAIPHMVRERYGRIINVSSIWGLSGASMETHYAAAKAGVAGFTKALAKEYGPSNILVNCVAPGIIDTEMNAHLSESEIKAFIENVPLMRIGKPEDVAALMVFLASEQASYITGQIIGVDGGY